MTRQQQELIFPIQLVTDPEKIKAYHLRKLYELSLKSLGEIPRLEEPSFEQKSWVIRRMKAPSWTWRSWSD